MLKADGFDEAILGTVHQAGGTDLLCYSSAKVIEILVTRDGMSPCEAMEYFDFNIAGAYMGSGTPVFLDDIFEAEF